MAQDVFQMEFGGHALCFSFLYPATRFLFHPLPKRTAEQDWDIRVPAERMETGRNFLPPDSSDAYVEYRCLIEMTARSLLRFGCSIFHAVSFAWRDRAWLLTAPSGVGKTTQFLNWQRLFPGEITMISGDMPVLEAREDGCVWVHPSAWNGKESLSSRLSAPLGGLVLLQQGQENRIGKLTPQEALVPIFAQFPVLPETEEDILRMARLEEKLLLTAPSWKLVNLGDDASTALLRDTLLSV